MRTLKVFAGLLLVGSLLSFHGLQSGVPKFSHVIIVIEENHAYHELIGSANSPYISKLARGGERVGILQGDVVLSDHAFAACLR